MNTQTHWEKIYAEKAPDAVSWYRPHLETSLALIEKAAAGISASVIDVGGGESTLVDDLLAHGYVNITVLDISQTAIDANKPSAYDVWHDRAVFHFLTSPNSSTVCAGSNEGLNRRGARSPVLH
jgi:2-polyprenyl-3-methyl-5-hydroxy-6-metoxy-1,4-benzoquinol methylase